MQKKEFMIFWRETREAEIQKAHKANPINYHVSCVILEQMEIAVRGEKLWAKYRSAFKHITIEQLKEKMFK